MNYNKALSITPPRAFPVITRVSGAFTLAEVLITIAIIGIVAAMTIPTLISKYQRRALETGFKKSYSKLTQALVPIQNEFYGSISGYSGQRDTDFYNRLWENYKKSLDFKTGENEYKRFRYLGYQDIKTGADLIKDYAKKNIPYPGCPSLPTIVLSDGSAVGGLYNCYGNWIVFDTNGKQGPNAIGHDIFYFGLDKNTRKLIPLGEGSYIYWNFSIKSSYCSKNSMHELNGLGCTKWALQNKCPDDETKTYWECLP